MPAVEDRDGQQVEDAEVDADECREEQYGGKALFGLLANNITPALFPFYLLALLVLMVRMHEQLVRKTRRS